MPQRKGCIPWNKGIPRTEEEKKKISLHHADISGDKNPAKRLDVREKISKALKGKLKTEEHKKKLRKPKTDVHKKHLSENHADVNGIKNPMYGKLIPAKKYEYNSPLQGKIYFRGRFELEYAKYLDSKKILWMYEMETFDLGDSTYTPDFFLPQFEKFVEIKGWMTDRAKNKIDKFLEQYPWDLEILGKEDLIKLGVKL